MHLRGYGPTTAAAYNNREGTIPLVVIHKSLSANGALVPKIYYLNY